MKTEVFKTNFYTTSIPITISCASHVVFAQCHIQLITH